MSILFDEDGIGTPMCACVCVCVRGAGRIKKFSCTRPTNQINVV